jgi:hypothetical protein
VRVFAHTVVVEQAVAVTEFDAFGDRVHNAITDCVNRRPGDVVPPLITSPNHEITKSPHDQFHHAHCGSALRRSR